MNKTLIGIVGPFSGPRDCYGKLLKQLTIQSKIADHANILFCNDQANADIAEKVAEILVKKKVDCVIGHFNSASAERASSIYTKYNIPLLMPASTKPSLTSYPLTFRICPNDFQQILAMVEFIKSKNISSITIWNDGSHYGKSISELFMQYNSLKQCQIINDNTIHEKGVFICFGAHYHVADKINEIKKIQPNIMILCCDDCSIYEFTTIVENKNNIWYASPAPDYAQCIVYALNLIKYYAYSGQPLKLNEWLKNHNSFTSNRESLHAKFKIISLADVV
jgi:hypothetical protein